MIRKKIIVLLVLLSTTTGYSQAAEEVFKQMAKVFSEARPLQYTSSYILYKEADSKKIEENYKGVFYKNASNEVYTKIGDTEIINLKTVSLKISHAEKAVEFSNPVATHFGDFDIKQLTGLCKISAFNDKKTYWEIILIPKNYTDLPYSEISIQVSKSYFLQKQVFYYNTPVNFSKDYKASDLHNPKLEIIYTNYNRNTIPSNLLNSTSYFRLSDKKKIILSEKLIKYDIVDKRN